MHNDNNNDNNQANDKKELPQFRRDPNAKVTARQVSEKPASGRSIYSYMVLGSIALLVGLIGLKFYMGTSMYLSGQRFTQTVAVKTTSNSSGVELLKNVLDIYAVNYTVDTDVPPAEAGIFVQGIGRMDPLAFFSMISKYKKVNFNSEYSKNTLILYGSEQCSRTVRAMEALDKKNVPYVFVDLSSRDADIQGFYARFIASGYNPRTTSAQYPLLEFNDEIVNYPETIDMIDNF